MKQEDEVGLRPWRPEGNRMQITTIEVEPQPMLHVTRSAGMAPGEIAGVTGQAFGLPGAFFGRTGVTPAGPPLAVYRDWDGSTMTIDVGFPVAAADTGRAEGEIRSGPTPSGRAVTALYQGPYEGLRKACDELEAHMEAAGLPMPPISWKVYLNDPGAVEPEKLMTQIYIPAR